MTKRRVIVMGSSVSMSLIAALQLAANRNSTAGEFEVIVHDGSTGGSALEPPHDITRGLDYLVGVKEPRALMKEAKPPRWKNDNHRATQQRHNYKGKK